MRQSFFTTSQEIIRCKALLLVLVVSFVFLVTGCSKSGVSRGAYPVDFFTEMHYAQSYRTQEPPSLSAPSSSLPAIDARGVGYVYDLSETLVPEVKYTLSEAQKLQNPIASDAKALAAGAEAFQINCAVCHGTLGTGADERGDGAMRAKLRDILKASGHPPKDLTALTKPDGEIYLIIGSGFAGAYGLPENQFVMPPFEKLLTAEERWALVHYIRSLQNR